LTQIQEIALLLTTGQKQHRLYEGQILPARVLSSANDEALLAILGARVPVKTRVPLIEGSRIKLQVGELLQDGGVSLKVLPENPPQGASAEKSASLKTTIRALAAEQGIKLTADGLNRLVDLARGPGLDLTGLKALLWLHARGLPTGGEFLKAAATAFARQSQALALNQFASLAEQKPQELPPSLVHSYQGVRTPPSVFQEETGDLAAWLKTLPDLLGLRAEARLGRGETEVIGLKQLLQASSLAEAATAFKESAVLTAGLTRLQLLDAGGGQLTMAFLPPETWPAQPSFIKIKEGLRDASGSRGSPSRESGAVIYLDLPFMGQVLGRVHLADKELTVKLEVERQDLAAIVTASLPALTSSLEDKGFQVRKVTCVARAAAELRRESGEEFGLSYEGQVDFQV